MWVSMSTTSGTAVRIAASTARAIVVRGGRGPGRRAPSGAATPRVAVDVNHAHVVDLVDAAHARVPPRSRARGGRPPPTPGSMCTTTSLPGSAPRDRLLDRSRRRRGPAERRVGRRSPTDDVDEVAPAGLRASAARRSSIGGLGGRDRRAGGAPAPPPASRSISTCTLRAQQPLRRDDDEHGDDQRGDRVARRRPGAREQQAGEHGDRAGQVGREVQRVGGQRRAAVARARRAARRRSRPTSTAITTASTAKVHHAGVDVGLAALGQARDRLSADDDARQHQERRPRPAPRGARPCRVRRAGRGRAGRTATRSASNVSIAATRSVPECTASASRPSEPETRPATSLSVTSNAAASTEPSAERRTRVPMRCPGRVRRRPGRPPCDLGRGGHRPRRLWPQVLGEQRARHGRDG